MAERYDTVLELHVRVRRHLERIAEDPNFAQPGDALRAHEAFLQDEFGMLHERSRNLTARGLIHVLGSTERVRVYAELLGIRAACLAAAGDEQAAAVEARRALSLHLEDALDTGALALDPDGIERLRRLMGDLELSPDHARGLRTLCGDHHGLLDPSCGGPEMSYPASPSTFGVAPRSGGVRVAA